MHAIAKYNEETHAGYTNIQYINSIGALIDNRLLIHTPDRLLIEIESIRRAEIHKSRSFIYNFFFLLCAMPLIYFLFTYGFTKLEQILVSAFTLLLLTVAFKIKTAKYILCIRKLDMDYVEMEIPRFSKEDAKSMVKIVNRRIRQLKKK